MWKKSGWFTVAGALFICLAMVAPASAQKKKEMKMDKVWGMVVPAKDSSGKLSTVALETQKKEIVPLATNAVVKKIEKKVGQGVEAQGKFKEVDGNKVLEVWTFVQKDKPEAPTKKAKADAG